MICSKLFFSLRGFPENWLQALCAPSQGMDAPKVTLHQFHWTELGFYWAALWVGRHQSCSSRGQVWKLQCSGAPCPTLSGAVQQLAFQKTIPCVFVTRLPPPHTPGWATNSPNTGQGCLELCWGDTRSWESQDTSAFMSQSPCFAHRPQSEHILRA